MAPRPRDRLAGRGAGPSSATNAEGPGAGLRQLLCPTSPLPAFQEEGPGGKFPLSRPGADQARPGQLSPIPAEAGLAALPAAPAGPGRGQAGHADPTLREVVRCDSDRTGDRAGCCARRLCRRRPGDSLLCNVVGRHPLRTAEPVQAAAHGLAQGAAEAEPEEEVQQQLEEGKSLSSAAAWPHRPCPARLSAQAHDHPQQKPRKGVSGGPAGKEHVPFSLGIGSTARDPSAGQVRPESRHPRSGLARVPASAGLQAGLERRRACPGAAPQHQSHLSSMRACVEAEPAHAGALRVRLLWIPGTRRSGGSHQRLKGRAGPDRL